MSKISHHFDNRADQYAQKSKWVTDHLVCQQCIELIRTKNTKHILDLGGGTGYLSSFILDRIQSVESVTLVDASERMLSHASDNFIKIRADISELTIPSNLYDLVLLRQVLHYVDDPLHVILNLKKAAGKATVYIGQIVAPGTASQQWLSETAAIVSKERRRIFMDTDVIHLMETCGFSLERILYHSYRDNIRDLLSRSDSGIVDDNSVRQCWQSLTDLQKVEMEVDGDEMGFSYGVTWLHCTFSGQGVKSVFSNSGMSLKRYRSG